MQYKLYAVRHGETQWNAENRVCGRTDLPLTPAGLRQAAHTAELLAGLPIERIYSSPMLRARQTDDTAARAEAYDRFQEVLAEDPPFAFLCYIDASYVANSSIRGIDEDTVMGHHGVGIFWNAADWTISE